MDCPSLVMQENTVVKKSFAFSTIRRESRKKIFLALFVFIPLFAYSQRKSDIGFFAGTSYYMGDLNPVKHFRAPGFAAGPFYRYNFEQRNSIRFNAIYHSLSGNSASYGDPYIESLNTSFDATFIDASANYEINFLPYKTANRKLNRSLYLTGGLGYHFILTSDVPEAKNHFFLPFGIGYKVNIGKKLSAGAELTVRKTFSDLALDGVTNITTEPNKALFGNKDWYTFAGIFISYKIFSYREDCPAYD